MKPASRAASVAVLLAVVTLGLAACADAAADEQVETGSIVVDNCGEQVSFGEPAQKVMLLESAPVTILDGIGAFDRVISRAGQFPDAYYDDELATAVEKVPSLTEELNASGHITISQEEIISQQPDLVLGLPEGMSREALGDAGINVLVQELYCPNSSENASFETLYDEIERYGLVFDRSNAADALIADLKMRVDAVTARGAAGEARTAVVLYPTTGGGTTYAYGAGSMAEPQLEALGLRNIFAENSERVFEVQAETLIDADPDVIILLYQGSDEGISETIGELPGSESLSAVVHHRVFTQLFNFTEPASPLTVTGLEMLADELDASAG